MPPFRTLTRHAAGLIARRQRLAEASRPVHPDTAAALTHRWHDLPAPVRTAAQLLGRRTVGCEGTHGVSPRCDRLVEADDARDLHARDVFLERFGGMDFARPALPLAVAVARVVAGAPGVVTVAAGWAVRFAGLAAAAAGRRRAGNTLLGAGSGASLVPLAGAAARAASAPAPVAG